MYDCWKKHFFRLRFHNSGLIWKRRKRKTKRFCVYTDTDYGADLFKHVTFVVVAQAHFLNVVGRKRSGTWRCVNTVAVNILLRFVLIMFGGKTLFRDSNFLASLRCGVYSISVFIRQAALNRSFTGCRSYDWVQYWAEL
jgi:hypothetical protein